MRGAYTEPVNKSLLLLPTMSCQVHTSSQHIIINCTLNYSVQLTTREWGGGRGRHNKRLRYVQTFNSRSKHKYIDHTIILHIVCFADLLSIFPCLCYFACVPTRSFCFATPLTVLVGHISIFSRSSCIVYRQEARSNSTCPSVLF